MTININDAVRYSDYRPLVSDADWERFFEDKAYDYRDPLGLAILRTLESIENKIGE